MKIINFYILKGNSMFKKISFLIVVAFLTLGSGCSTYNSIVPDWASIGSTSSDTKATKDSSDSSSWWNPFSWF